MHGQFQCLSQFSTIEPMPVSSLADDETNGAVVLEQPFVGLSSSSASK